MILQLDPPIPMYVVDKGNGLAHLVIDHGPEHNLIWVVFLDVEGICWCARNPEVRGLWNETMGRIRQGAK